MTKLLVTPDSVALPANQSVNVAQIAGSTTSTAATGTQKVGIVGNAGAAFDAATNAAPPANAFQIAGIAATALPAPNTATNLTVPMTDKFGRQVVLVGGMRDIVGAAAVQTTNSTQTSLIAAVASTYTDLLSLDISNESATACTVALTDGTATYKYNIGNQQGAGFVKTWTTPLPASSSNTAWQVTGCSSVTLDYVVEYLKDK
jgi:hypothetical protein